MKKLWLAVSLIAVLAAAGALATASLAGAATWTLQTGSVNRAWTSMVSSSDGMKLAGTETNGFIYTSSDGGASWTARTNVKRAWSSMASSSDGTRLAATATYGDIWTSSDSGVTWVDRNFTSARAWTSIASSSDGTHLAATVLGTALAQGRIYTSADSGATWTQRTSAGDRAWTSIASSSDGTRLVAVVSATLGTYGRVWTSADSGETWTDQTGAGSRDWISVTSSGDGTHLAAAVAAGHIYTSSDSGVTWSDRTSTNRAWKAITSSRDGTYLAAAVGVNADIWTSVDSGVTWVDETGAGTRAWTCITMSSNGTRIAAAGAGVRVWIGVLPDPTYTVHFDNKGHGSAPSDATAVSKITFANLPSESASGYTFLGWSTTTSGAVLTGDYTPTANSTLYAQWVANSNSVTYNNDGATTAQTGGSSSYTTDTAFDLPTGDPVKTGYAFTGWFTEASGGTALGSTYTPLSPFGTITIYAHWSANDLTVTFDVQDGSPVSPGATKTGETVTDPGEPTRTGYVFTGWFTSASGGSAIVFPYAHGQTTDFTLFAHWSANTYSVTFDNDGATTAQTGGSSSYTTDTAFDLPTGDPVKTGYTFIGWFTEPSGGTALGSTYTPLSPFGTITIYAHWSANNLTVTFDAQDGSPVSPGATKTGETVTDPGDPTRAGYTFTGWFAAASGGLAVVFPYPHGETENFTLYAQWTANDLAVTFDTQDGSPVLPGVTKTGETVTDPGDPTKTGYTFTGWFTAASGGSAILFPHAHGQTSDFTLYAQWSPNTYTITFDNDGATSAQTGGSSSYTTDAAFDLPIGDPVKAGYTFIGWFTEPSGGTALGSSYTPISPFGDITIYARWSANDLTVTFDAQDGTQVSPGVTKTGGTVTDPGNPTRVGYTFAGWFTAATGGSAIVFPYAHGETASFKLYAQWTPYAVFASTTKAIPKTRVNSRSETQTVFVRNTGTAPLVFGANAVSLTGTNASDFTIRVDGCSNKSLITNATCKVSFVFRPSAAGARTADLVFADNTSGSPSLVTLNGLGTTAPISIKGLSRTTSTTRGGNLLIVTGRGFYKGAQVTIGGVVAEVKSITDEGLIVVRIPPHVAGTVNVVVTNLDTGSATYSGFRYF